MRGHHVDDDSGLPAKATRLDATQGCTAVTAAPDAREPLPAAAVLRLQRAAGNEATSGLLDEQRSPVYDVVESNTGRPLAADLRADMESRLGHDFSDVRLHTDERANESAVSVGADAYTVGSNVVFAQGRFDPETSQGRTVLLHELTHVVQQREGAVDGHPGPGGIRVSAPSDRFEREAVTTAERAMALNVPTPVGPPAATEAQRQQSLDDWALEGEPATRD